MKPKDYGLEPLEDAAKRFPEITDTYVYGIAIRNQGNYDDRKVARYDEGDLFVSTTLVYEEGGPQYETAIAHPEYNEAAHIIVEIYPDKEAAEKGHKKWVELMTAEELPDELTDVLWGDETYKRGGTVPWKDFLRSKGHNI